MIIPTRNRPRQIARCLEALRRQDYPRARFEVIPVTDGYEERTVAAAAPFRETIDLTVAASDGVGISSARNAGSRRARGEILAFTDDDCAPAPDWIDRLVQRLDGTQGLVVGGGLANGDPTNPYMSATQLVADVLYEHFNSAEEANFFGSLNFAIRKDDYDELGGFEDRLTYAAEDSEFFDRARLHGLTLVYAPEALIYHAHDLDAASFVRQHFNYGRGAIEYRELRPDKQLPKRNYVRSYHWTFLRHLLRAGRRRPYVAALVLVQLVAYPAGIAYEDLRRRALW